MSQRHGAPLRLLSLDGGGIRGLSSLLILKSLFEMVAQLKGHPVMPHEIFDMISGTSTGGLIAVMLGPLSMDIQTCIDTYLAMAPEIFPTEGLVSGSKLHKMIGMFRGKNRFDPGPLETFLRRLVAERVGMRSGHGEDTTMQFEWTEATGEPHCKIFLCVTSEKFGGHFRLRSYHVPGDAIDCPIWQACRATSAAPTIFPPMRIGKPNDQAAFVDGGLGKNNPTLELIDEAKTVWQDKRDVGCVVSVGTGMMPMVDVRQNAKALVRSLAAMATDTQEVAKAVKLDMIRTYGPDQKVYHRFNVDHGLDGIGLEEWKEFSAVKVATQNYIQENMDKLKSCAAALVAPPRVGPPDQLPSLRPRFLVWADRLSTHFVGRETELASISSFFANPCSTRRRVAMYGLPGMGKSQLVYQYMATNMKRYNAVFFADATSVSTMSYAYVDIFKALKIPDLSNPPDQGTRINSVKDWLRRRKDWLLVFDNLQEADYNEWKTFLPYGDTGHIMITTRSEWVAKTFTGNYDGQCLRVEELDFESAPRLLLRAALLESRQEELRDLAKAIVEKLWYILLAIEFVGRGHQSEHLLRTVLAALENTSMRQDLEAKYSSRYGVLEYRDNPTTFLTLYAFEKLTPRTQEVWRVMAFLDPAWYSESLFQYIRIATGIPLGHLVSDRGQLRAAFGELLGTGIIQQVKGDDGYWTHDLIHEISRVFLKTESMDHDYAGFAASWLCSAFPDYSAFGKWHGDRYFLKHAETCVGFAEDLRLKTRDIQRLLFKASNFARFIGNYKAAERLARRSVNEFDSEAGAKPDLFAARDSLAIALRRQSRFSEARCILDQNLAEQRRILGDKDPGTLSTMNEIGYNWFLAGDADRARPILEEVKEGRLRVLGPGAGPTQHTFQNLAACLTRLGEYERAEELYKLARDGHEGLFGEDHHWVQHIRGNIAQLQEKQGRMQDALAGYRGVYEWRKANPNFGEDHPDTLRVAVSLTRVYHELGRDGDALSLGRRIRDTFLRIFGEDHPETKELDMLLYNVEGGRRQVAIRCYQSCQALAARSTQNQLVSPIAATLSLLRMWHQTGLSNSNGAITPSRIGSHGVSFQTQ